MIIAQPECVFVALSIQHAMRVRHIFIRGLTRSTILSHIRHDFGKKVAEHETCVLIFPTIFV